MRTVCRFCVAVLIAVTASCASTSNPTGDPNNPNNQVGNPLYSLTLLRQGSILLQQQRFEQALEKFQESNRVAPGNPTTHNMIGLCHLRMGHPEQALPSFETALDLAPSFTDARNNRGVAYAALEQYQLAEVDYLAVLRDTTYPHRSEVHFNLAMTYFQRGKFPAAEENLLKAIEGQAPVFEAFLRLSEIASQTGDIDQSLEFLEDARTRFPQRAEAALAQGRLLLQVGRSAEARKALQDVTLIAPGTAMAEEATELLGET